MVAGERIHKTRPRGVRNSGPMYAVVAGGRSVRYARLINHAMCLVEHKVHNNLAHKWSQQYSNAICASRPRNLLDCHLCYMVYCHLNGHISVLDSLFLTRRMEVRAFIQFQFNICIFKLRHPTLNLIYAGLQECKIFEARLDGICNLWYYSKYKDTSHRSASQHV